MYFCLLTLSAFCTNGLEEQCTQFPEIITSTYEMNLKLGPVVSLDKTRRYVTDTITLVSYLIFYLRTRNLFEINSHHQVEGVIYQLHLSRGMRQGNYYNNLATRGDPIYCLKISNRWNNFENHPTTFSWGPSCLDTNNIVYSHYKKFFSRDA